MLIFDIDTLFILALIQIQNILHQQVLKTIQICTFHYLNKAIE
jgi:hypothetical protein